MGAKPHIRVLAIATNPEIAASTRFRIQQWANALREEGFTFSLDAFYSPAAAEVLYQPGRHVQKVAYSLQGTVRRLATLSRTAGRADILFVHREAFPLGLKLGLPALKKFPGAIVYDYDDAMFLPQRQGRGLLAKFEDPDTPKEIMALSDLVLAGNRMLEEYARRYAKRVVLMPTCVDTEQYTPRQHPTPTDGRLTIGWVGTHSTAKYLQSLMPVLQAVARMTPYRLYVVGNFNGWPCDGLDASFVPWSLPREVEDFRCCDVGIYPLWNDQWAQGKCGWKAIQFMACEVPVVASAVGANLEIIQDGVNGFLVETEQEWIEKLRRLLTEPELRRRFGVAARRTIEQHYSLRAYAGTLSRVLRLALEEKRRSR